MDTVVAVYEANCQAITFFSLFFFFKFYHLYIQELHFIESGGFSNFIILEDFFSIELLNQILVCTFSPFLMRSSTFKLKKKKKKSEICFSLLQNKLFFQKVMPWDSLRRSLCGLAHGPESFLAMRNEYARSLAVFSIAGYVLGIGDRHLDNFLLDKCTGQIVRRRQETK